jgi:hypothetical protein
MPLTPYSAPISRIGGLIRRLDGGGEKSPAAVKGSAEVAHAVRRVPIMIATKDDLRLFGFYFLHHSPTSKRKQPVAPFSAANQPTFS